MTHSVSRIAALLLHDPRLLARYVSAGATAALFEFLLFTTLYQVGGWPLLAANCTALAAAIALCFVLQKYWTFRITCGATRQVRLYLFMQAISAVMNNLLMIVFVEVLDLYAPLGKVLQIGIVFLWNYSFCRIVVFVPRAPRVKPTLARESDKVLETLGRPQ